MEQIKNIMFICTGNTCRSAMAEGLMKKMLEDKGITNIKVCSAGLRASTGEYSTDEAIMVMKEEYDVNLLNHQSVNVKNTNIKDMDLVCNTCSSNYIGIYVSRACSQNIYNKRICIWTRYTR